eukprot:CAMPEP_0197407864 /NCGR_PEP_ID=MMETSP1165-20131217/27605_1 /TAXON_ID=284809 /ORGANISM="Chrysocystis fragilis, Strain CCMP3189" /LENGTH=98 /DNA_ID=CAMNT_0042934255 /DNA_START=286 /DNA_END=578 /DNA_ORIENTATION=+
MGFCFDAADYEPSHESTSLVASNAQSACASAFRAGEMPLQYFTNMGFVMDTCCTTEASELSTEPEDIPPHKANARASVQVKDKTLGMSVANKLHVPTV